MADSALERLAYCGNSYQLFGVEEQRLVGGRADGLRVLEVKNGRGLQLSILLDRGCGIARLSYKGINCSFLSASGLRHPAYFEYQQGGFLRNFHAGFLTNSGIFNVGVDGEDDGEELFLHGDLDNTPATSFSHDIVTDDDGKSFIEIKATIPVERIGYHKVVLKRIFRVALEDDYFTIHDHFTNTGSTTCPMMLLYHMNMGYPLLDQDAQLFINSSSIKPRTELAAGETEKWAEILPPTPNYPERCYYHDFAKRADATAAIYQPKHDIGLAISFDNAQLPYFCEWKQYGYRDYTLGLEPGNSHCDGRAKMRADGTLQFLEPQESKDYDVKVTLFSGKERFAQLQQSVTAGEHKLEPLA